MLHSCPENSEYTSRNVKGQTRVKALLQILKIWALQKGSVLGLCNQQKFSRYEIHHLPLSLPVTNLNKEAFRILISHSILSQISTSFLLQSYLVQPSTTPSILFQSFPTSATILGIIHNSLRIHHTHTIITLFHSSIFYQQLWLPPSRPRNPACLRAMPRVQTLWLVGADQTSTNTDPHQMVSLLIPLVRKFRWCKSKYRIPRFLTNSYTGQWLSEPSYIDCRQLVSSIFS